jgi:hypothetical protein
VATKEPKKDEAESFGEGAHADPVTKVRTTITQEPTRRLSQSHPRTTEELCETPTVGTPEIQRERRIEGMTSRAERRLLAEIQHT